MLDWKNINTVLLDMDGTLLDLHFDNHFWLEYLPKRYAEIHSKDETHSRNYLIERFTAEQGTLNWYCLDYWSSELDVDIPSLKREISHMVSIRPFVEEFLTALDQAGKEIHLVTNAHDDSVKIKMEETYLEKYFHSIISSHHYQEPKEEQAFWQHLIADLKFDKSKTLFVDDSMSVLASAEKFGIGHLLTLKQPDSKRPSRNDDEINHPAIHHFDEVMPIV